MRELIFLILLFFYFLIALKALDGSLEIIELKDWLVLTRRDLIRILDNFLLSLHNLLIMSELGLVDLTIFRFLLICANRGI